MIDRKSVRPPQISTSLLWCHSVPAMIMSKMSAQREWRKYSVGEPSTRANWTNPDCCLLETVHHICHVSDAFRMLEDGRIRSSLIWDESRLNNTRTCVSWLSPNHWSDGSLYGNIEFHFNWRELIEGKNFFWVEAMNYRPNAFRILITEKDQVSDLEPYPVEAGDGPLFFDKSSDKWYWNVDLTGEFMLDEDLPLRRSTGIGFCNHHPAICRKDKGACPDLKLRWERAGAILIAKGIAQGVLRSASSSRKLFMDASRLNSYVERCVADILFKLLKAPTGGQVKVGEEAALPLAAAILDRFARGKTMDPLTALFADSAELELALRKRMAKAFDMELTDFPSTADDF